MTAGINAIFKKMSTEKLCYFIKIQVILIFVLTACCSNSEIIKDIQELKQDHMFYIDKASSDHEIVKNAEQKKMDEYYNMRHFSVWHQKNPQYLVDEVQREFEKYSKNPGYGENRKKHTNAWIEKLIFNADLQNYPNLCLPAITVNNSNLRILPTNKPHYFGSHSSANSYPFDNLQVSAIHANMPIYISHRTKDKAWLLAETDYYFGWIPSEDVAYADTEFMKMWESGQYAVIIKDKVPLIDKDGKYLFKAMLGSMFPKISEDTNNIQILAALTNGDKKVYLTRAFIPKDYSAIKPLRLTTANIAKLANELINEPYGWGGLYGNRDCSAMTRDLFAPFGIWLHRNSSEQAKKGGTYIDLEKYSSGEKEKKILEEGIPYLTLIWRRGHIMLYIGSYQGEPLVFHNFWSVRSKGLLGKEEKKIVGHAAITTLHPDKDVSDNNLSHNDLLADILGMTLLVPKAK